MDGIGRIWRHFNHDEGRNNPWNPILNKYIGASAQYFEAS